MNLLQWEFEYSALFFLQIKVKLLMQTFTVSTLRLHPRSHPQQLLSALLCNFPGEVESATSYLSSQRMRWTEAILLQGVVEEGVGVNTSTPLHLLVWLHCGLLSSSCPLTGSGGWGAGTCHILWHAHKASRDKQISGDSQKERRCGGKKKLLHWKMAAAVAAISSSLLPAAFLYFYLMGRHTSSLQPPPPPPPSGVGQIGRVGLTKPLPLLLNNRITKSFQRRLFECHVIDVMSAVGPGQESDNPTTTDCTNGQHRQHDVQLRLCHNMPLKKCEKYWKCYLNEFLATYFAWRTFF